MLCRLNHSIVKDSFAIVSRINISFLIYFTGSKWNKKQRKSFEKSIKNLRNGRGGEKNDAWKYNMVTITNRTCAVRDGIESICNQALEISYPFVLPVRFKRSSSLAEFFGSSPLRNVIQSFLTSTVPCLNNGCIWIIYDASYMLFFRDISCAAVSAWH